MEGRYVLGIALLLQLIGESSGGSTLKIQMLTFKNSNEKDWNGRPCEPLGWGRCDHFFKFCLGTASSGDQSFDSSDCSYFLETTAEFPNDNENDFGHNMNGVSNPIVQAFPQWPSAGVKFKIEVKDDDSSHSSHDLVDRLRYLIDVTPKRSEAQAIWQKRVVRGFRDKTIKTSCSFKFKVYCDDYYFGSDCSKYCKAQDNSTHGHYTCHPTTGAKQCRTGWEGSSCKISSDDCASNLCQKGGTCVDGNRRYTCRCLPGFTGTNCNVNINECHSGPCVHGDCLDLDNAYRCVCKTGYVGQDCAMNICQAAGDGHCQNGGTCGVVRNRTQCSCHEEYEGERCEISKCKDVVCENGGTCNAGKCHCLPGYAGAFCRVDLCDLHPCGNGGTCVEGVCQCANGAHGRYCEFACNDDTCKNDGTCVSNSDGGYTCLCLPRYNGTHCQLLIPDPPPDETGPEEVVPPEDGTDDSVPDTDDDRTSQQPNEDKVVATDNNSDNSGSAFPAWIIGLVVGLIFAILIVILAAYLLVKRYKRRAHYAEDTVAQMEIQDGILGCSNPVYIADPMPAAEGAVGPSVVFHCSDPPPYKEKLEDDDPAYSQIAPAATKTEIHIVTNTNIFDRSQYDVPRAIEPTYDSPRPTKPVAAAAAAAAADDAEGAVAPALPSKKKDLGVEAPPLPDKQKDLGEQAPALPDKQQM